MQFYPTVLGICGWKNSGKTTLIEKLIPKLRERNLRIAVVKSDAHGIEVDHEGKDSKRFFDAGADVALQGPGEEMIRFHKQGNPEPDSVLGRLAVEYDLVLVEGHKGSEVPKIWLLREGETDVPDEASHVEMSLPFETRPNDSGSSEDGRVVKALAFIEEWLNKRWTQTPVFGCLLIGGKSSRMGSPKHLLKIAGRTWIEKLAEELDKVTERVVIAGSGDLPDALQSMTMVPDVSEVAGPMAGIVSCMRWNPHVSWIVAACDMPMISARAIEWLLSHRKPGVWAAMPTLTGERERVEPLLSYYDMRIKPVFETLVREGRFSAHHVADHEKAVMPQPERSLHKAWKNVNSLKDLAQLMTQSDMGE